MNGQGVVIVLILLLFVMTRLVWESESRLTTWKITVGIKGGGGGERERRGGGV